MSLAARIRFYSRFLAVLMLLHLSFSIARAGEDDFFIKEIMKEQQPNMNRQLPDWLKTKPAALESGF
jgi:conjugal transfer pilus assembly protein TraW